jgi:hypothetical protein
VIGLGDLLAGWNLLEKLAKLRVKKTTSPDNIATRFIRLFECYGVHRNQIPGFIGYGLTLKDVQDDDSLLAKLDEPLLEAVCEKFAVRREWLDGADEQIYPCHDFYKHPNSFRTFIEEKKAATPNGDLQGVLIAPEEGGDDAWALLILQETVGWIGDKPIYRFHLCNNWLFSYWKARAYLTACIAIAWKHNVFVMGRYLPKSDIEKLAFGYLFLGRQENGVGHLGRRKWNPEDMALDPSLYLDGVDPEQDDFGTKSGLELWIRLEEQGYMDIGIESTLYPNPKQSFRQTLAQLNQ